VSSYLTLRRISFILHQLSCLPIYLCKIMKLFSYSLTGVLEIGPFLHCSVVFVLLFYVLTTIKYTWSFGSHGSINYEFSIPCIYLFLIFITFVVCSRTEQKIPSVSLLLTWTVQNWSPMLVRRVQSLLMCFSLIAVEDYKKLCYASSLLSKPKIIR